MKYVFEESIPQILNKAVVKIKRDISSNFNDYDITIEQWALLTRLWEKEGISQTQISIRTGKDLPSVTRMIDKLEKKDVVIRRVDPSDSRAYLVFLTQKGKELEKKLNPIAAKIENKALENIKKEDLEILRNVLTTIITNLD